ncbi:MAG: Riboflavin biosynthesis protein RibF [bacterium]|nr:Riboflavin biosynthesis protein RibF [bacterium]
MPPLLAPDILQTVMPPSGVIYGLGTFDGVHRGHLHLIDEVLRLREATGLPAWILVLYRDPANPLFAGQQVITTQLERDCLFSGTALDGAGTLRLTSDVTQMSHEAFVQEVLLGPLQARHLVVGWDFHYGHARVGNVTLLQEQLQQLAGRCELTVLNPVMDGSEPIKSTTIRSWIQGGDIARANAWLTRPYFMRGQVVTGRQVGREIGFPTANLGLPKEKLLPAPGVYCTIAETRGGRYWAATNVGRRPTVESESPQLVVEAHLLDFTGDLYGHPIRLHFVQQLRSEQHFASLELLRAQIARDVAQVRHITMHRPAESEVLAPVLPNLFATLPTTASES